MEKVTQHLPTAISFSSIAMSWVAISFLEHSSLLSFLCILAAFILDTMDGHVARKLNAVTQHGRQLDSLADTLIYLVWPALFLQYVFRFQDPVSVAVQAVFLIAGLYRLARFNSIGYVSWRGITGYPGLPVVFSHCIIVILLVAYRGVTPPWLLTNVLLLTHSLLMVQRFPFPRPKTWQIVIFIAAMAALVTWRLQ